MRHCQAYSIWSDPETAAAPGHHGMSYALIRIDRDLGRVIGARCPEPTLLKVGDVLDEALDISPDSIATYTKNARTAPPLFVRTRGGLGLLSRRYDLQAGMGLFLHFHVPFESAARVLNHGSLGEPGVHFSLSDRVSAVTGELRPEDEITYRHLSRAWATVVASEKCLFPTPAMSYRARSLVNLPVTHADNEPPPDACDMPEVARLYANGLPDTVPVSEAIHLLELDTLADVIRRLAAFAGCEAVVEISSPSVKRALCYRPILLEGVLLYLLSEVHRLALDSRVLVTLGTASGEDNAPLYISLLYVPRPPASRRMTDRRVAELAALDESRAYLRSCAYLGGLDVAYEETPCTDPHPRLRGLRQQVFHLTWLFDPTILPSTDLKADPPYTRE